MIFGDHPVVLYYIITILVGALSTFLGVLAALIVYEKFIKKSKKGE